MKIAKMKNIIVLAAFLVIAPALSHAQEGPWEDVSGGSSSWGDFNSADPDCNSGGSSSWGDFDSADPESNSGGFGLWGAFNNDDPGPVPLGSGFVLLTAAGLCYAGVKRGNEKRHDRT